MENNKSTIGNLLVRTWQMLGICSIALLIYVPNGKTIISNLLEFAEINLKKWNGIGYENLILICIFLIVYFSNLIFATKSERTKKFFAVASSLMVITIITAAIFTV